MEKPIILHESKKGPPVRIFRPSEFRALVRAIPKNEYKDKLEALLYSGSRYEEMKWLYKNPKRFQNEHIHMKNMKALVKEAYRWIHLNLQGQRSTDNFLRGKTNLPAYQNWDSDIKRWCILAGISPHGACAKSTRKTWESWLVITYPSRVEEIFISQGHVEATALKHYLAFPFDAEDRKEMLYYVEGW